MAAPSAPSVPPPRTSAPDRMLLLTTDGERLEAAHLSPRPSAGAGDIGVALAHGFAGSWQRPPVRAVAEVLAGYAGVLAFDFRGHGGSTGRCTLGDREVLDVDAAVGRMQRLGYRRVVTCGWAMGGAAVLRHAALRGGVDGVVSVSAPSREAVPALPARRRSSWLVERRLGRAIARSVLHTRVAVGAPDAGLEPPVELVGRIAPIPLLLVHGDGDTDLSLEHPRALAGAAAPPCELWEVPGFGHGEAAAPPELLHRLGRHLPTLVGAA